MRPDLLRKSGARKSVIAVTGEATRLPNLRAFSLKVPCREIRSRADPPRTWQRVLGATSLLFHSRDHNFGLALRPARCKFVTDRGRAFSKQSILRNPADPAERECSAGFSALLCAAKFAFSPLVA